MSTDEAGMSDLVIRLPQERGELRRACLRVMERGGATSYSDAHIVARWLLGLVSPEPVACRSCGIKDTEMGGLVSKMHAALNWERRVNEEQKKFMDNMKPNDVLIVYPISRSQPMLDLEQHAQKTLGRRCLIMRRGCVPAPIGWRL